MKNKKVPLLTCLALMVLVAAVTANICILAMTERYNARLGSLQESEAGFKRLKELISVVDKYYVGEYDPDEAMDGVLAGFVNGMGDRWSGYYNEEEYQILLEDNENSYVGIGVTISTEVPGEYRVTEVSGGSPAQRAGIVPGDYIVEVDGESTDVFEDYRELVSHVRGEAGTNVSIGVRRDGELITFELTRGAVFNTGVEARIIDGNIGYMHIDGFSKNVDVEFGEKLDGLLEQGAEAFIFDVRFNGGGYVDVMTNILDRLMPKCTIITMSDNNGKTTEYTSEAGELGLPMAVITNEYSISAAEFFAAVLQEYGLAPVIGDRTIGKGYAQTLIPLSEGAVNLSTLKYYTPKGVSLAGVGITPDVEISLSEEDFRNFYSLEDEQDTQLQKAVEVIRERVPAQAAD